MGIMNLKQDYEYFTSIWGEKSDKNKNIHTSKAWDGRAGDWGKELDKKNTFQESMDKRVFTAAEYLRSHGLLEEGSEVIDLGCGPGRFVTEFAKTAGHVTGIDISEKMIRLGKEHAQNCGIANVTFMAEDFHELDVMELGWEKKFDLVFMSITPAADTLESLEKAMKICKGYCFNSSYIRWEDDLESKIQQDVLGRKGESAKNNHGKWFYSLFNMLWIRGYFPQTHYYNHEKKERLKVDKTLATYYARELSKNLTVPEDLEERIMRYLTEIADSEGCVERICNRWQGWILWDVRNCMPRLKED